MKPSVKKLGSDLTKILSTREDKKRVNIRWNHGLYFQIGLIVSLIIVFFVMEANIGYVMPDEVANEPTVLDEPYRINKYDVFKPEIVTATPQKKVVVQQPVIKNTPIIDIIDVRKDTDVTVIETPTKPLDVTPVKVDPPVIPTPVKTNKTLDITQVEFVPIFPGCESMGSNKEKVDCMSSKIGEFINNKFNKDRFTGLNAGEIQRIYVQFKIDAMGNVTDVNARALNSALEKEGERVISKLPKMKPARQGNTNVDVLYVVPIAFKVE